jgi:ribosomal protein S18 acetylase RimI-like enzyme
MKDIIYRKARLEDCRDLSELKRDVWITTYSGIYPREKLDGYDVDKNESIFRSFVERPDIELFLAENNGEAIGLMTVGIPYKLYDEYDQEVALLYIRKDFQRQGIGRGFLEIAKDEVRRKGFDRFVLSVNEQNENAIAFYEAMGGTIVCQDGGQRRMVFLVD